MYTSFLLNLSAHFQSTVYWEVYSDINYRALSAALTHPCTFLVKSHDQNTLHAPSRLAS